MRFRSIHINNTKGSAAVMVMSIILILTTLGLVALMGSVAGIKMGSRYKNWSNDFYELDKKAESTVQAIDTVLASADSSARTYMESEGYKLDDYLGIDLAVQTNFKERAWMNQFDTTVTPPAPNTYEGYISKGAGAEAYKLDLDKYYRECFNRVYYYYMATELAVPLGSLPVSIKQEDLDLLDKFKGVTTETPKKFSVVINSSDPNDSTKKVEVEFSIIPPTYQTVIQTINRPIKGNPLWGYAVAAGGGITISGTTVVVGDMIASNGNIDITANNRLEARGNLYASGDITLDTLSKLRTLTDLTKDDVDSLKAGSAPYTYEKRKTIYGDTELAYLGIDTGNSLLYSSALNPYINGNGNAINSQVPFLYKDLNVQIVDNVVPGNYVPAGWGNIYARNFLIKNTAENASATIDGNLIVTDDLELNGVSGNHIVVNGNFLGLSSEGAPVGLTGIIDHNNSSTILNNSVVEAENPTYTLGNTITLNGGVIVPGVAFREFDKADGSAGHEYYQTFESISGRDRPLFEAYLEDSVTTDSEYMYLTTGTSPSVTSVYPMKKSIGVPIETRRADFKNYFDGVDNISGNADDTTIHTFVYGNNSTIFGYALGAVLIHNKGDSSKAQKRFLGSIGPVGSTDGQINAQSENLFNWQSVKGAFPIKDIFKSKTENFGFDRSMAGYLTTETVDVDALNAVPGMLYLDVSVSRGVSTLKPITYCNGNLTITGSGTFEGIIIASGNITIDGDVSLNYSEAAVINVLENPKAQPVRDFFYNKSFYDSNPRVMDYAYYQYYDAAGGTKSIPKRYEILRWQEMHVEVGP